jgi:hypothetical protein
MRIRFRVLLTFFCIFSFLFGCEKTTQKEEFLDKSAFTEASVKAEEVREVFQELRRIGSTIELGNNDTCKESGDILAYAKTYAFRIYICGDEINDKPKSMIIFIGSNNSQKISIEDNASIDWLTRSHIFNYGIFTAKLERPTNINKPKFYVYFADKIFFKEDIQVYLFNEKIVPNYKKSVLKSDKKATERFLRYSFDFHCQADLGGRVIPKRLIAYEIYPNNFLVQATCFPPQYNGLYQYILYSENLSQQQTKIIPFNTLDPSLIESGEIQKTELLMISGLPRFFPEDNTLRIFHKGIGAGGCGSAAEYKLIEEKFELQEFRKYDCYSSGAVQVSKSPEEFPKIYP